MTRAAIYNRCSTDMETQLSALETQVAESREIVANMGWELVMQYVESESATTKNRPLYQKMLEDISRHQFDVLVIKSIDRINRNVRDFYFLLDCLTQHQVKLYLYLDRKYYEAGDSLITGIKAILAEDFSRELSRKIRNAHERRQKLQSGYNITRAMFGWDKIGKDRFELNPEEAEYYRQAFDLAREGYGYRCIARIMYERGARTREGAKLTEAQWRNMLRSPRAHGEVILNRVRYNFETKTREKMPTEEWIHIRDALPAILCEESHQEILQILDNRAKQVNEAKQFRRGNGERGKGIFANKIECACCGRHYYRIADRSVKGKESVWKCASYIQYGKKSHSQAGCDNVMIRESILKEQIWEKCQGLFAPGFPEADIVIAATQDVLRKIFTYGDEPNPGKKLRNSKEKLMQRKDRLMEKLMDETITEQEFRRANSRLQKEVDATELKLAEMEKSQKHSDNAEKRIQIIREKLIQEKQFEHAKANYLLKKISRMKVFPDGRICIFFEHNSVYGILDPTGSASQETPDTATWEAQKGEWRIELQYHHITIWEEQRWKYKEQIYQLMKQNPHITIPCIMEQLGLTRSYVNQRIGELKMEQRISYNRKIEKHCWEMKA